MKEAIEKIKMYLFLLKIDSNITWDRFHMRAIYHCDLNHAWTEGHWLDMEGLIKRKI